MKEIRLGLTYSDVLLVPKRTPLNSRIEANIKTKFSKNIALNIPLVSSNMATVTEHKMAIAMAREGGLGVIHQFGTLEEQCEEVKRVKRSTSYIIENPITITPNQTIKEAINKMKFEGVTSLLVVQNKLQTSPQMGITLDNPGIQELVGIFTAKDYLFELNLQKSVSEVMTPKERLITAQEGIKLNEAKQILQKHRIEKLPILMNGQIKGLMTTKDIKRLEFWPNASRDQKGRLMVGAAVGVKNTCERAKALIKAGADVIILDIAHCHSDLAIQRIKELKFSFNIDIVAGNIATGEAARDLIEAGADGLKVGIGPSPVCTTRIISGSGVPQLTAVIDVCKIAKEYNVPVSADGGIKFPGDLSKAIAAGAMTAYCGSLFAGTDEAPGMIVTKDGKRYKRYMGSASYDSNHERKENLEGKRHKKKLDIFVEGVSSLVDYKGPVRDIIKGMTKGLRSGISYCGARNILEMQNNAEFMQITSAGWEESKSRGKKISD